MIHNRSRFSNLEEWSTWADVVHTTVCSLDNLSSFLCSFLHCWNFGLLHLELGLLCNLCCASAIGHLLVRRNVERDEQEQVRAQDYITSNSGKWLAGTGANMWQMWSICTGEVIP